MSILKKLLASARIWFLIIAILLSVVAIYPNFSAEGVAIRSVTKDSPASLAGIISPKATATPMSREKIIEMNGVSIKNSNDYYSVLEKLPANKTVQVKTNNNIYLLRTQYEVEKIVTNETELKTITELVYNETTNKTTNITRQEKTLKIITKELKDKPVYLGLSVYDAPTTNLRKGLDLQGGTRVLLSPAVPISQDEMSILVSNVEQRINVYGISDVTVRPVSDLSGNQYIRIEIAGATEEEVKDLISKQGKFEAKVNNITVFRGGADIRHVCRTAECSGIDPYRGCGDAGDGTQACTFRFSISLSPEAASRQAEATKDVPVVGSGRDAYLEAPLELYLDDSLVDKLNIASDLKGKAVTEIAISGPGVGKMREEAVNNALQNMKKLQTILITGSLPVKMNIVKIDTISPVLGDEFLRSALIMAIASILAVTLIIYLSYRAIQVVLPVVVTMISEVIILLGIASLIGWNLDLASIAGIIVAVGTGVDDQIIITDEIIRGEARRVYGWKEKIKSAFFVIMGAYLTAVVSMIPLFFAGAGLLKGFALTTIIGVSVGVFITRPAYAAFAEIVMKK